jgi:hypothetical protein
MIEVADSHLILSESAKMTHRKIEVKHNLHKAKKECESEMEMSHLIRVAEESETNHMDVRDYLL